MKLIYAHYPSLEDSFIRFVRKTRQNALSRWLVVCSSTLVSQRLKERLAREFGASANMYFMTQGALVSTLDAEAPGEKLPLLPQDALRDFLIKNLLEQMGADSYPISRGSVQALKSSLRDMADSLADPAVVEEQARSVTDEARLEDAARLLKFNRLYQKYQQAENQVPGYRSYQTAFENALEQVESSAFLHSFEQIVFYGFYDMPGRAWELVRQIRDFYPMTVFAPYLDHPSYHFAHKFFETNWLGSAGAHNACEEEGKFGVLGKSALSLFGAIESVSATGVRVVCAPDEQGEVFFVAKEILRLTREEGYQLSDIGVIARSTVSYQDEVRRVFRANGIALDASFAYPLHHFPLGVFCQNLFSLALSSFAREKVFSLISSPYFKHASKGKWRVLIARSLVSRGLAQWKELLPATTPEETMQTEGNALLDWLDQVSQTLTALAQVSTWEEGVRLAVEILNATVQTEEFENKDAEIFAQVTQTLLAMKEFAGIRPACKPGEFISELADALGSLRFNEAEAVRGGVVFTDASRARGLQFKVVFVLGLNDEVFPVLKAEDPVLRDYDRYVLRDVLGYWMNQSFERRDEEKLLFFSAVTSAQERLYALYHRVQADGSKEAVPSIYLSELMRAAQIAPEMQTHLSERLLGRLESTDPNYWTQKEMSNVLVLHPAHALQNYAKAGLLTENISRSLPAAFEIHGARVIGKFDGVIESGKELFERVNAKGFSPSTLQNLALCPMRFFFDRGLKLAYQEDPLSRDTLAPNHKGTLYHQVLEDFYTELHKNNLTHTLFASGVEEYLNRSLEKVCSKEIGHKYGIYPVVWEVYVAEIHDNLLQFLQKDLQELGSFTPFFFEKKFTMDPVDGMNLRLHGTVDRIDVDEENKQFRVIDYKSSSSTKLGSKFTQNLGQDTFSKLVFQPFLYSWFLSHSPQFKNYSLAGGFLLVMAKEYKRSCLSAESYQAILPRACALFTSLGNLVKNGTFFIRTGGCTFCPYVDICRKGYSPALTRANASEACQNLEEALK